MNWSEIAKQGTGYLLLAIVAFISAWVWRDNHWETVIRESPVMRDTVVVRDTVSLPPVVVHATRIDTVSVAVVDSVLYGLDSTEVRDVLAYLLAPAATDTVFHGEGYWLDLSLGYSPLYRDFFISADLILDKETITGTRMVFKETPWWHHAALALSAGVTAYGIAKEDWWVAGIGGAGLVGVSITL